MKILLSCLLIVSTAAIVGAYQAPKGAQTMDLGALSISLAVKDLDASRAFYEKLGFTRVGGDASQNWLILRNGSTSWLTLTPHLGVGRSIAVAALCVHPSPKCDTRTISQVAP